MVRLSLVYALIAVLGGSLSASALPRVDAVREGRAIDQALIFVPEPEALAHAASGFEEPLASLAWVRTVLIFGDHYGKATDGVWLEWLRRMLRTVYTLDPSWRTVYFHGGSMLRASGDVAGSDAVFEAGHLALPQDPYFPFSLGMNAYLHHRENDEAARWLDMAARLPGAPPWYAAATAAMKSRDGDRLAGIRYLEEVLLSTDDPATRADAEWQLARLRHEELVASWQEACRRRRERVGPLPAPAALAELGFPLPTNPRGDDWIVGADGVVRSEGAERDRVRLARRAEWAFVGR